MMSLGPKIDELRCFANDNKPDLISLTETWIYDDTAAEHHLHIPGYSLCLKNRKSGIHGGVGLYINNSIKYKALTDLYHPEFEVLWAHLRPVRLPRGFPCIVEGTVYHTLYPKGASDTAMIEYLISTLTIIEGRFPGCGIILSGDFNRLNISRLLSQFKLKQFVCVPTRGDRTLDLILTNMPQVYNKDLVQTFPPFGLSDHAVVLLEPKPRSMRQTNSRRSVTRRDTRESRICELGRYLGSIDWSILESMPDCESKLQLFQDLVKSGLDNIMPLKTIQLHVNDPPWVTVEFKGLIRARQKAFSRGDTEGYRRLRNITNRERKLCRGKFYASKVANLKITKPSQWWRDVKMIAGMTPATGREEIRSHLHLDEIATQSNQDIANMINSALLEPLQDYAPLAGLPPLADDPEVLAITSSEVCNALLELNPKKAGGPDGINNWLLRVYADFLCGPVCDILNASYAEQKLPSQWKDADVSPLMKIKPVTIITKHIRPISLTPALSKIAEDFVVGKHVAPAVLEVVDPNQYGAIPDSSTLHALISMIHTWAQATDATGSAVRVVCLDYRKAFDFVDHTTLATKIMDLRMPRGVARWVCDFLMDRRQRVKLSSDCFSEWGTVPSGVPQGTKLGPWLFILMINDLRLPHSDSWKYVDDTTVAEVVARGGHSGIQVAVDAVEQWSSTNKLHLNADKCKELIIDFKKAKHQFDAVTVNSKEIDRVNSIKLLGVTISDKLQWNCHVSEVIKKANKRMYFLILLKRANVPAHDIIRFYCTCIRPVLEYCSPLYHHALPDYLCKDIERIQRRALAIIAPGLSYNESLYLHNLQSLESRRLDHSQSFFECITNDPLHKLHKLLPPKNICKYNLRNSRTFSNPVMRTKRLSTTFIPSMSRRY